VELVGHRKLLETAKEQGAFGGFILCGEVVWLEAVAFGWRRWLISEGVDRNFVASGALGSFRPQGSTPAYGSSVAPSARLSDRFAS
jgi:hypothetical protein